MEECSVLSPRANRIAEIVAVVVIVLILVALLLPSVQVGHTPARVEKVRNNFKQLGLAMHNYLATNKTFPARAILDKNGQPLLSWRVAILPYLDEEAGAGAKELYDEFHLDEPWDSDHNRTLISRMPAVFKSIPKSDEVETPFLAPVGDQTIFGGDIAHGPADVSDGLANTIMLVQADHGVPWTKPADLDYDAIDPMRDLGHAERKGFHVLFSDGHAWFILDDIHPDQLRGLMTINGGEDVKVLD